MKNGFHLPAARRPHGATLITGGAGFIGTNLAASLLAQGRPVVVFDNFSRPGVARNVRWLRDHDPAELLRVIRGDVRDAGSVAEAVRGVSHVFHFAAQVAVTTSVSEPVNDFEVNARGTLNLLEAMRREDEPPSLIFTSTNKVYGDLQDIRLRQDRRRYEAADNPKQARGIGEDRPVRFHSPYGCSKGAADQYVLDYARTFGLPTCVFRMSCIYGPHQCGTEDQGWVAHFVRSALEGRPITLYGDGKQVRDLLYVADLVEALLHAERRIASVRGQAFNIGGGLANSVSLLELAALIEELHGGPVTVKFADWRTADQRYYVSDTTRFQKATGWRPRVGVRTGVSRLYRWLAEDPPALPVVAPFTRSAAPAALRSSALSSR